MERTTHDGADPEQFRRPENWGEDELTDFLDRAFRNSYYTVIRNRARLKRLRVMFSLLSAGAEAYSEKRGSRLVLDESMYPYDMAIAFYMSCRVSLLAGVQLTFGHVLIDAAKPLRGAVESALYAFHIFRDPSAWDRWADRPKASALRNQTTQEEARRQRRKVGAEFSASAIARELFRENQKLASEVADLYEELVDAGGHHNIVSMQAAARVSQDEHTTSVHFTVLGGDDKEVAVALDLVTRTAFVCLRVFAWVFREFWPEAFLEQVRKVPRRC